MLFTNLKKSDFIFLLENLKSQLQRCFQELPEDELETIHSIQGFNVTGFSAIAHVLEHFSYHSGQIALLTKYYTGKETGFYTEMDINKHNNQN